jgi:[acyl-carrier-protein] S-malonyltransferase
MKTAYVFPGQGSQSVGMLSDIESSFPQVKSIFEQASDILGYDMRALIIDGPAEKLNKTEFTQPALLTASYAIWELVKQRKPLPNFLAGHSLGEYSALVCAQALTFEDGLRLVSLRGRLMQEAVAQGEGAMAAIVGLDDESVQELCKQKALSGEVLSAVNYNAPGQVVIAGHAPSVHNAVAAAKEFGAKLALVLPISVPSHCSLMHGAADKLAEKINNSTVKMPLIPVVHNVNAMISQNEDDIRQALIAQLFSPVKWVDSIRLLTQEYNVSEITEIGPGAVLTGLLKRIESSLILKNTKNKTCLEEA